MLVIGDAPGARIKSLDLRQGALVIRGSEANGGSGDGVPAAGSAAAGSAGSAAAAAGEVVVDGLVVENEGWEWQALDPDSGASEEEYIRGFRVVRHAQQVLP